MRIDVGSADEAKNQQAREFKQFLQDFSNGVTAGWYAWLRKNINFVP